MSGATPVSIPDPWTCESWLSVKQHRILETDPEYMQPSGEPFPSSARYCHLADTVTESSKSHSTILPSQMLGMAENMMIPMNFTSTAPLQHFFCCEGSSLIRRTVVWNAITVDKAFYECMDGSFGKNIACREGKSVLSMCLVQ